MRNCLFRKWRIKEGYTVNDFALEATKRGESTDPNTVWRWDKGTIPHPNTVRDLKARFKTIQF